MTNLASLIDHTYLGPAGDADAIRTLCREAKEYGFASVCVNPAEVPLAVKLLKGSGVKVCTVIGFPLGQSCPEVKAFEIMDAVERGAQEVDVVVNQRLLKHDRDSLSDELTLLAMTAKGVTTKLILECCNLTKEEIVAGCELAKATGFDFVKTSTGFGKGGATVEDVKLMRKTVGPKMGVKAAGGIRTLADAEAMVAAGATRLGCSAGVAIMKELESK